MVRTLTSSGSRAFRRSTTWAGSTPGRRRMSPSSMLPGGVLGNRLRKVSRLVRMLPSAPKEAPAVNRPATRSRLPATSLSTVRPSRNHFATGPNSSRDWSSKSTRPFCVRRGASAVTAGSMNRGSRGSKPRARIERVPLVWGLRHSSRFQCTGVVPITSGSAMACTRRRWGKPVMLIELLVRGLSSTRSVSNSLWTVMLESNRASRKPSCMNIRIPAKVIPARATARRMGWRVSSSQARGIRRPCQNVMAAAGQSP